MHKENFKKVLDHIEAHPETWNQRHWHSDCGTAHCVAGHAQIMSGKELNETTARIDARAFLGLDAYQASYAFASLRTLQELKDFADGVMPYDFNGRDIHGYDRDGYDCDGLDRNNNPRPE